MADPAAQTREWLAPSTILGLVSAAAGLFSAIASFLAAKGGDRFWLGALAVTALAVALTCAIAVPFRSKRMHRRYRHRMRHSRQLRKLRLLGAQTLGPQLDIDQIYQDVSLTHEYGWSGERVRKFGDEVRASRRNAGEASATRHRLDWFLEPGSNIAVRGVPGSGKSTLLRKAALKAAASTASLPILVPLARHAEAIAAGPDLGLAEVAVAAHWLDGSGIRARDLRRMMKRRHCLILLDGLDEVPEDQRAAVAGWTDRIADRHGGDTVVLTSRPHGFESARFTNADKLLEIRELTPEQVEAFVRACHTAMRDQGEFGVHDPRERSADLLRRIRAEPSLEELASNPLLLHLMVYVHQFSPKGLPTGRADLYDELIKLLLHHRRSDAGVRHSGLPYRDKRAAMQALALHMMSHELTSVNVTQVLREELHHIDLSVTDLVAEVSDNGLLVPTGRDTHSFAHLTFQEYLAACEITDNSAARPFLDKVPAPWWRETFLLWAAANPPMPIIDACIRADTSASMRLALECAEIALAHDQRIDWEASDIPGMCDVRPVSEAGKRAVRAKETLKMTSGRAAGELTPVPMSLLHEFRPLSERTEGPVNIPLWPEEVDGFVAWINSAGWADSFRLPTPREAAGHPHPIWTNESVSHPRPNDCRNFTVSFETLRQRLHDDFDTLHAHRPIGSVGAKLRAAVRDLRVRYPQCESAVLLTTAASLLRHPRGADRRPATLRDIDNLLELSYKDSCRIDTNLTPGMEVAARLSSALVLDGSLGAKALHLLVDETLAFPSEEPIVTAERLVTIGESPFYRLLTSRIFDPSIKFPGTPCYTDAKRLLETVVSIGIALFENPRHAAAAETVEKVRTVRVGLVTATAIAITGQLAEVTYPLRRDLWTILAALTVLEDRTKNPHGDWEHLVLIRK